ncbi:uncharacterized protein C2845_PM12G18600 [Panicum miliaceum]|uniref:Uncharacterized protein n=1 Tax=Panicum miliaceum TaxID=4540 RepID=A0A3L6QFZ0_PANMI|nr:uncharacterized protein C2845_PM12G18600 [Panicum miliaceum]
MGCRRASSSTLLMVILAVVFLLTLDRPTVAHARHVRSPSLSTGEHLSRKKEGLQGTRNHGAEHSKNTYETVRVEKGSTGEAAGVAGASLGRRGGNSGPAASAEKVVVARYGPRPHPKKHN